MRIVFDQFLDSPVLSSAVEVCFEPKMFGEAVSLLFINNNFNCVWDFLLSLKKCIWG